MTKTISEDDRLKALALAVTANDLYRQACKFDMTMIQPRLLPGLRIREASGR